MLERSSCLPGRQHSLRLALSLAGGMSEAPPSGFGGTKDSFDATRTTVSGFSDGGLHREESTRTVSPEQSHHSGGEEGMADADEMEELLPPEYDPRLKNEKMMQIAFQSMAPKKTIPVPPHPAPPSHLSPRTFGLAQGPKTTVKRKPSMFERMSNSTTGRFCTFSTALVCFVVAAVGFSEWQRPSRVMNGESPYLLVSAIAGTIIMYTCVPPLARCTGMADTEAGWKPYLAVFRCSFLGAVPSLCCLAYGYGSRIGFGEAVGTAGSMQMEDLIGLSPGYYFEASDGFVALNLTKGVAETAAFTEHGQENQLRYSRYRDAELKVNYEPYTIEVEPTTAPGMLRVYVMAPIFANWAPCTTRYRTSAQCINGNPVMAWAVAKTESLCTSLRSVACLPPDPLLRPVYMCSTKNTDGFSYTGQIQGLCGRTVEAPPNPVIDEYSALLINMGFPVRSLPNSTQVWVDVWPDDCIAHPESCLATWDTLSGLGIFFAFCTVCCIVGPLIADCVIDKRIRAARAFFLAQNAKNTPSVLI